MIKLLLFLFFIACAGFAAAWLAENSGNVTMYWLDYRIDTSVAFLLVGALLVAFLFAFLLQMLFAPSRFVANFFQQREMGRLKRGINELTYSVAALAASDVKSAQEHTRKLEKLLGRTPLYLLLSAQISKTQGDELTTNALLEQLMLHKETNYLAARTLSDTANKHDDLPKALALAKQAQQINPKDSLSSLQVLNLQVRLEQWAEAQATLQQTKLPRKERARLLALINIVHGEQLLAEDRNEEALYLAKSVIPALPYFIPAAEFAARAYRENDQSRKADKILKRAKAHNKAKGFGEFDDGIWQCRICGNSQKTWGLHCDNCHSFDSIELKEIYGKAE